MGRLWVNYKNSLTWIKAIWGWFLLLTMIIVRSQWGRYNLPRRLKNTCDFNGTSNREKTMTINEIWMILQETKPWAHFHPHVSWEEPWNMAILREFEWEHDGKVRHNNINWMKTLWQFESWKGQILPAGFGFFSMCDATGGDWTSFPTSTIVSWTGMLDMKRGRDNFPAYQCNYLIVHPHWILWISHESTEFIVLKILILVLSCYNYWSIPLKLVRGTGLPTQ